MQSKFRLPLLTVIGALLILSSCSKSNEQGKFIPKNAALVVLINGETISSKLPWEEVKKNELFKQAYDDSTLDSYIKMALDNPDNTGIDTKKEFLFFLQRDSTGGYIGMEGAMKDAAKFKQFYNNAMKGAVEKEKDGIHYLSTNEVTASWKKDKFIIVADAPMLKEMNKYSNSYDAASKRVPANRDEMAQAAALYDLKASNSLGKDEKFTELVKEKGDIHFWFNMEEFSSDAMGIKALEMVNLNKLYDGSITTATASFEEGKINFDMKSYTNKEMAKLWKKYEGKAANTDMMKRYSGKDVAVMMAFNFKPEGIREFIKLLGMEGLVNMGTAFLGFTMNDFIDANKGDIFFAMSDMRLDTSRGYNQTEMNVLFAASVGDKKAFGKLIDAGNKMGRRAMGEKVFYNTSDKYFAIGNNKEAVNVYTGAGANSKFEFIDKISGSPMAGFVNIQYLLKSFQNELSRDSLDNIMYDATLKTWDNIIFKGGEFKDGGTVQHAEVNLIDKKSNSLKVLNEYLSTLGRIQKEKELKRERAYSDYMTPPVVEEKVVEAPVEAPVQ